MSSQQVSVMLPGGARPAAAGDTAPQSNTPRPSQQKMAALFKELDDLFLIKEVQVTQQHYELWWELKIEMMQLLAAGHVVVNNTHVTELSQSFDQQEIVVSRNFSSFCNLCSNA